MKCYKCQVTSPLFRTNEKGVPAVWACKAHVTKPVDPVVNEIATTIHNSNTKELPHGSGNH